MAHAQKPDFVFQRNRRIHLNRRGASVESTTGSRGVCVSGSNAGYTMFRGSVKSSNGPLQSHMDFGPVVKPLGITVKKEAGKVVETSGEISPLPQESFEKEARAPRAQKRRP